MLPSDKKCILDFNKQAKQEHQIHLELLPEPYLGNPQAKIILLNLNSGFSESDILFHRDNAYFAKTSRANFYHESQEYPFYLLDPKNLAAPGSGWWRRKLRWLIDRCGLKKLECTCLLSSIARSPYYTWMALAMLIHLTNMPCAVLLL